MASNNELRLLVFGLSEHEQRVLRALSILSKSRSRTYVLKDAAAPDVTDFAVVDGDDPQALKHWQAFQALNPSVPAVMVGKMPVSGSKGSWIGRPIVASRLLSMLDRIHVSEEHQAFAPPKAHDTEPAPPAGPPPVVQQPTANTDEAVRRALVVDDSLPVRKQMELELERFVEEVDLAEDGERAIALLSTKRYDIVFLDVVLPGMDGYQICRMIKRDQRTKDTPVIMLTGKSSPFDRVRGKLAGCDTYLTKPVDHAKFNKEVKTYLRQGEHGHLTGSQVPARAAP